MSSLSRTRVDELMDHPAVDPEEHRRALHDLAFINRLSFTAESFLSPVLNLARTLGRSELSLLDVACGGGDVPVRLAVLARKSGVTLKLHLVDRSATALATAEELAKRSGISCESRMWDASRDRLPSADIVSNSLFLHHLDEQQCVEILREMARASRHLLLVSDLRRSPIGLAVAWTTCRLFSRSPVVHHDGPASVRAAWTMGEMRRFCATAGIGEAQVRAVWPWRMLIEWRRGK